MAVLPLVVWWYNANIMNLLPARPSAIKQDKVPLLNAGACGKSQCEMFSNNPSERNFSSTRPNKGMTLSKANPGLWQVIWWSGLHNTQQTEFGQLSMETNRNLQLQVRPGSCLARTWTQQWQHRLSPLWCIMKAREPWMPRHAGCPFRSQTHCAALHSLRSDNVFALNWNLWSMVDCHTATRALHWFLSNNIKIQIVSKQMESGMQSASPLGVWTVRVL